MEFHKIEIVKLLEINMTKEGFSLWKTFDEKLPDIWEKPVSSTGKYHKKEDGSVSDIAEHVYEMLYVAIKLFRMFSIKSKTSEADMLLLAITLHDCLKYGDNGQRRHTDNKHDKAAGDMIRENRETFEEILTEFQVDILEDSIRFHSGQWSTDILNKDKFNFSDRGPIVQFVHTLDMLSTADLVKTKLSEEIKELTNEYTPEVLRPIEPKPNKEIMYTMGTEHKRGEIGMRNGPNPELKEMLEVVGNSVRDCIIRFNQNGTDEILYRWRNDRWVKK